ncbi:MAG: SusC/RagA family TonB-linked outer membrane protein, partial [Actinomycetota bacterium]
MRNILYVQGHRALIASLVLFLWLAPCMIYAMGAGSNTDEETTGMMLSQQKITVTGTVLSQSDGLSLPGAAVVEKGTLNATTTDQAGRFAISVAGENSVVVVSFMGMKPFEFTVSAIQSPLVVSLQEDNFNLEEVIVTGYGSLKKEAYAGSASIIKMDNLADVPVTNLGQLLQGSTAGVQFTSTSGQPGAATQIRIRGTGSFNASNDPLYVVDGVPIISGNVSTLGTSSGLDILATMNPSDIESISIIKDAAAASLYGSRAANGVIIITTRKGSSGDAKVSLKTEFGFSDFAVAYRPFMDGDERRETIYEGLINEGKYYLGLDEAQSIAHADANIDEYAALPWTGEWTDWKSILFRKGSYTSHEVSVAGGTDKMKYYSSLGYTDQKGISVMGFLKRLSGRFNLSYDATRRLSVGANLLFSNVKQSTNTEGTAYLSPFYSVFNTVTPRDVPFLPDGSYAFEFPRNGTGRNPKAYADLNYQIENITRAFNTIFAGYRIIDNLEFRSTLSYDFNMVKGDQFTHPLTSYPPNLGTIYKSFDDVRSTVWSNSLQYVKTFAKVHNFDGLIAYETTDYTKDNI